jgi:4-hydroxy-tetrahydrodipicolinate reductase
MIELYINGSSGRMGTTINDLVNANDEFNVTDNLTSADVVIDFSHSSSTNKIVNSCLKHNIPMVIGTTGLNKDVLDNIYIASKTLPIVLAANMSIGVHQLKDSLKSFIKKNKNRVNCDIEETHHLKKLDKPSGTAIEIENLIKDEDTLNLISLSKTVSHRKDDISGIHKVIFIDKDVTYTYTHKAISRDIFGNGALYCAKKVIKLQPDLYTFEKIIN